jgi:uncharacterized protein YbaR (Trm112 family)
MSNANLIPPHLLDLLRCPLTGSRLNAHGEFLIAETGGLRYPVRDGIPVLLVSEAQLPPGIKSLDDLKKQLGLA